MVVIASSTRFAIVRVGSAGSIFWVWVSGPVIVSQKIKITWVVAASGVGRLVVSICSSTVGGRKCRLSLWIRACTHVSLLEAVISHGRSRRGRETIKMGIGISIGCGFWFDWAQQGLHPSSRHTIARVSGSTTTTTAVGGVLSIWLRLLLCLWLRPAFLSRHALCSTRVPLFVGVTISKVAISPPWMGFS